MMVFEFPLRVLIALLEKTRKESKRLENSRQCKMQKLSTFEHRENISFQLLFNSLIDLNAFFESGKQPTRGTVFCFLYIKVVLEL